MRIEVSRSTDLVRNIASYDSDCGLAQAATIDVSLRNDAEAVTVARLVVVHAVGERRSRHLRYTSGAATDARAPAVVVAAPDGPVAGARDRGCGVLHCGGKPCGGCAQAGRPSGTPSAWSTLIRVLVVATGWGFGLAALTSVASALAFDYFRMARRLHPDRGRELGGYRDLPDRRAVLVRHNHSVMLIDGAVKIADTEALLDDLYY
jgi:hypothetical protein